MPSVGSVTPALVSVAKTAAWTAVSGQYVLADATSAAFTVTLPASPTNGTTVGVKKTDSTINAVTVVGSGSTTIDGDTSAVLLAQGAGAVFTFDGTNWRIQSTSVFNTASAKIGFGSATASAVIPWESGRTYPDYPYVLGDVIAGAPPNTVTSCAFFPVRIPNSCTVTTATIFANNAALPGVMNIAFYADSLTATSGGPGVRLASATFTATTNYVWQAPLSYTFGGPQTVWMMLANSASPTTSYNLQPYGLLVSMLVGTPTGMGTTSPNAANNYRYTTTYTYSTFPADMSSTATTVATASTTMPLVFFTIA
jgi:hypothetical protein